MNEIMTFLKRPLFVINGFQITVLMALVALLVLWYFSKKWR